MKTEFLMLAFFGKAIVPLSDICEEYFGCSIQTAAIKAKAGSLPVPAFKVGNSQKSVWLVNVIDLAKMFDDYRSQAIQDWNP